jgi:hypothetical protein
MINSTATPTRDKSRRSSAKLAARTRRAERRAKSARLFLAIAFPADLAF